MNPLVSVIIPTLNSEALIEDCLKSIKAQTYTNIEIIVVDGHSTDNTSEIAKKYGKVFLYGPDQSIGRVFGGPYQRNYGAKQSNGKYIYLVDSDMVLTSNVIEECVKKAELENADAVIVPEISFGEGFWAKCKSLERACYIGDNSLEAPRFVKKEIWDELNGLDETLGGQDDWDLHNRLKEKGCKIMRINSPVYHNEGKLKLSKLLKKRFIYGKTVDRYFKKYKKNKGTLIKQYNLFRPAYFRNWRLLIRDPIHTIGFFVMRVLEYTVVLIGLIGSKLKKSKVVIK